MVFCEMGAAPAARTAEIVTRSSLWARVLSARVVSGGPACATRMAGMRLAAVANAAARRRRASAAKHNRVMFDSLRRYEPDQVLRDSLSLRPSWAGTPVNEGI